MSATRSPASDTGMGAVHLAVTDGPRASRFYRDYVGLTELPSEGREMRLGVAGRELVVLHPGAERPVVAGTPGGYHHHLGPNTWAGKGARPAPPGSAGLRQFTIEVLSKRDLDDAVGRLEHGEVKVSQTSDAFAAADPSANQVQIKVRKP